MQQTRAESRVVEVSAEWWWPKSFTYSYERFTLLLDLNWTSVFIWYFQFWNFSSLRIWQRMRRWRRLRLRQRRVLVCVCWYAETRTLIPRWFRRWRQRRQRQQAQRRHSRSMRNTRRKEACGFIMFTWVWTCFRRCHRTRHLYHNKPPQPHRSTQKVRKRPTFKCTYINLERAGCELDHAFRWFI